MCRRTPPTSSPSSSAPAPRSKPVEKVGADLTNVVTAQVVRQEAPPPDSDHMWLCQVSVGDRNVDADGNPVPLQIVCGAQNFEEGDHIVTAMIGRGPAR